jgi:hypothetical protein
MCLITSTTLAFIGICYFFLKQNYLPIKILFIISYLVFITSYLLTSLLNPGIPGREYYSKNFKNKNIDKSQWRECHICNILIPKHFLSRHCEDCEVCVREYDHHCPWTGKCIGKNNLKCFYIFVNSLCVYLIMIFVTFYCYMFYCSFFARKKK